ncbi:MAG: orotidine-5'-phosphate decarboxylase [Magnetovibrionaceae bacterium]
MSPAEPVSKTLNAQDRVFVAIDTPDLDRALRLTEELAGLVGGIKLGKEFFTANGPEGVQRLAEHRLPIFIDLKYHDIPNTVAGAVRSTLPLKPYMLNVHATGGEAMMAAAVAAAAEAEMVRPLVLAVTVLTSLSDEDLAAVGVSGRVIEQVVRLAKLAKKNGLDGVVCSAKECMSIRGACGPDFRLVVPGIRPSWTERGDQKRVVTPAEALALGADFLVIGRPITGADSPSDAAKRIVEELAAA